MSFAESERHSPQKLTPAGWKLLLEVAREERFMLQTSNPQKVLKLLIRTIFGYPDSPEVN